MLTGGRLAALLVAQATLCGAWAIGAWYYFHKQPLDACQAAGTALKRQVELQTVRGELMEAELWVQRGNYAAAIYHVPRARSLARQIGMPLDKDFDALDQLLCERDERASERLVSVASHFSPAGEQTGVAFACSSMNGDASRRSKVAQASDRRAPTAEGYAPGVVAASRSLKDADSVDSREVELRSKADKEPLTGAKASSFQGRQVALESRGASLVAAQRQISSTLLGYEDQFRSCAMRQSSRRKVKLAVRPVVGAEGKLVSSVVGVKGARGASGAQLKSCAEDVLRTIKWPATGGDEVRVFQRWAWRGGGAPGGSVVHRGSSHGKRRHGGSPGSPGGIIVGRGSPASLQTAGTPGSPGGVIMGGSPGAIQSGGGDGSPGSSGLIVAQRAVTQTLIRYQNEIRDCITSRPSVAGKAKVDLKLTIAGDGKLKSDRVDVTMPDGSDGAPVRACIEGILRKISWPTTGVKEVQIGQLWTWRIGGSAGGTVQEAAGTPGSPGSIVSGKGTPSPSTKQSAVDPAAMQAAQRAVTDALVKRQKDIRDCISSNAAGVVGRVVVAIKLTVSGAGQLASSKVNVTMPDGNGGAPVQTCVEAALRSIEWPKTDVPEVRLGQDWAWRFGPR